MMENVSNDGVMSVGFMVGFLAILVLTLASMWRIYSKAGEAGWKSLIPIYNLFVFQRIVGRPGWWLLLMIVPVVNIVISIVECADLARVFGKGIGYAIGLILLGPFFMMALAFGPATYQGPNRRTPVQAPSRPVSPPLRKVA
jgi:hypothetical protein